MSGFGGGNSEINNSEVSSSEVKEKRAAETGGETSEATQDIVAAQANEIGGFENGDELESFEEVNEEEKKGIIKDFLSKHAGEIFALGNLGYEGFKLLKTLQGDPQCPGSSVNISKEMLNAVWVQAKCWWETRKNKDSADLTEIDSPYGLINTDDVGDYQVCGAPKDEIKIGFDFDD